MASLKTKLPLGNRAVHIDGHTKLIKQNIFFFSDTNNWPAYKLKCWTEKIKLRENSNTKWLLKIQF